MIATLLLVVACASPSPDTGPSPVVAPLRYEPLPSPRLLRRLSLDLRGTLPSTEELDAVEADPSAYARIRDTYLADPRFEARLVDLYQERWRTQVDVYRANAYDFGYEMVEEYAFLRSVGSEPLRLAAHVVATDRPYTEILTADWTMSNEILADIFPVDYPADAAGWTETHYTDARPAAGVLATNGLWWRYVSPLFNYNRARTAAILDLFVCQDILNRPVVFDRPLPVEPGAAEAALRTEDACLSCHATVEPIAATLFGFLPQDDFSALEMTRYHAERERNGESTLRVEAAWYGEPVEGLAGLGAAIARDTRFADCAVETVAEGMLRRRTDPVDAALLREAREALVSRDMRLTAAFRSVTDSPTYQAGALAGTVTDADLARETTARILVAQQLRSVLLDLTGFTWNRLGADMLDSDTNGYRVMANGADGDSLTRPLQAAGLTWALVAQRAAEAAALQVAEHDLAGAEAPRLLDQVTRSTLSSDPAFRAQLASLVWRLHARRADDATLEGLTDLWNAAAALRGPVDAWATVLAVLLRDPDFLTY